MAVLALALVYISTPSGALEVHFLDIGQGDSIFIQTPSRRQVLIDGGQSDSPVLENLGNLMPFYDRNIDMVVVTHMDADHIGGLLQVLDRFEVGAVFVSYSNSDGELAQNFFDKVKQKQIPLVEVSAGDRFRLDKEVYFDVLWPIPSLAKNLSDNEKSVVLKLVYRDDTFLLTGDIEKFAEYRLAQNGANLQSDVLKVSHHGSNSSSVKYFLDKVAASIAIIQVGKNPYGHPHPNVLERLQNTGAQILRNDLSGVISIYSYGNSL